MSRRSHIVREFTVTGADQIVAPANANRTAVFLQGTNGSFVTYRFGEAVPAVGSGINVALFDRPLLITREQLGDLIGQPIHAFGGVAGHVTAVVEFNAG